MRVVIQERQPTEELATGEATHPTERRVPLTSECPNVAYWLNRIGP